jgi:uncharacterized protein
VPVKPTDDPVAIEAVAAIHRGDVATLERLLDENPGLATWTLGSEGQDGMTRSLFHVVADWPGHFPNGATTVEVLVQAGADDPGPVIRWLHTQGAQMANDCAT